MMTAFGKIVGVPGGVSRVPDPVRLGPASAGRCRRRIHLDAEFPDRHPITPAALRAKEELAGHRNSVFDRLRSIHPELIAQTGTAPPGLSTIPADQLATIGRRGPQPGSLVLHPVMSTETRSGGADLVIWMGDGYLPVIIRAHRTRDPGAGARCSPLDDPWNVRADPTRRVRRQRADRLALAHHYRQLEELGCASRVARGGVIGRGSQTDGAGRPNRISDDPGLSDDGEVIVWHDLDTGGASVLRDYDDRFNDRLEVARAAVRGGQPLALPSRIAECHRCSWWTSCSVELRAAGDISLLLTGNDVTAARTAGIRTITDLADLPGLSAAALPLTGIHGSQARVRARAWQLGLPLVRKVQRVTVPRADVELDVDAESYGEDGAYLWGSLLSGADVGIPGGYRSFVTWEPLPSPSQGRILGDFFGFVRQVGTAAAARGLSFAVFCYGRAAEERWMLGLARRYSGLPGVPDPQQIVDFCASPQWVDLLAEVKRQFVASGSLRLKNLAGEMGFTWRDPEPGGENSMAWYRTALGPTGLGSPSATGRRAVRPEMSQEQAARRVLQYNEDDVLATLAVRTWIGDHLGSMPTVAELDADPVDPC